MTEIGFDLKPYPCQSRERKRTTIPMQNGWRYSACGTRREAVIVHIDSGMSLDCRYDAAARDPRCRGCPHPPIPKAA